MSLPALLDHLTALEVELHHPGVRCARARLEELLHPEFHEVGRSGRRYTRDTVIEHLASLAVHPAVESSGFRCEPLADGVALLTYRSVQRTGDGEVVNATWRSSIWRQQADRWQLFHHQGTPAADD